MTLPGFLHTSPVHVATFDALLAELRPGVQAVHVVDESLLADARAHDPAAVAGRVTAHLASLRDQGAQIVCCTCSTIGDVAEQAGVGIPVFRVDRPMAGRAVRAGARLAVIAALRSTLAPTQSLLEQEAGAAGREVEISLITAEDAWERFEAGDQEGYLDRVAQAARQAAASADVVVLAQASMADAQSLLRDLPVPVLSSARPAVEYLISQD
ncbi:aspartate/glutamate racemase family protein [Actinomycetota bacterium]